MRAPRLRPAVRRGWRRHPVKFPGAGVIGRQRNFLRDRRRLPIFGVEGGGVCGRRTGSEIFSARGIIASDAAYESRRRNESRRQSEFRGRGGGFRGQANRDRQDGAQTEHQTCTPPDGRRLSRAARRLKVMDHDKRPLDSREDASCVVPARALRAWASCTPVSFFCLTRSCVRASDAINQSSDRTDPAQARSGLLKRDGSAGTHPRR
jgi:hypothetical protein